MCKPFLKSMRGDLQVKAGLKAIYCSGWQVAGDANTAGDVYPDQSLYPANAVPELVRKLNKVRPPPSPPHGGPHVPSCARRPMLMCPSLYDVTQFSRPSAAHS